MEELAASFAKTKEQLHLLQGEYQFYKDLADKLEFRQTDELGALEKKHRLLAESGKDLKLQVTMAESENEASKARERKLAAELGKVQRDLKSLVAVNEEYQDQALQFKEREQQFAALSKEYREKLEQIKFERERMALKEEQFCRQVQRVESQAKAEARKLDEKS